MVSLKCERQKGGNGTGGDEGCGSLEWDNTVGVVEESWGSPGFFMG